MQMEIVSGFPPSHLGTVVLGRCCIITRVIFDQKPKDIVHCVKR